MPYKFNPLQFSGFSLTGPTPDAPPVTSVNGQTGAVVITKDDIGLDQVDNTSDADKPISTAQDARFDLNEADIAQNSSDIAALDTRMDTAEADINALQAADIPYSLTFNSTTDWSGPVGGDYFISVLAVEHEKGTLPKSETSELVSGDYEGVSVLTTITTAGQITIKVNSVPDLRFEGRVLIF